jgi:HAD superfamily hydrolase (TIGR01662 family)
MSVRRQSGSTGAVPPSEGRIKTLWVREPYLSQILAGRKTVEVRVGYDNILRLKVGDALCLNGAYPVTIRRTSRYASFDELLAHEGTAAIAPGLAEEELLPALRDIYPAEKEALGVVALEVELLPETRQVAPDGRYDAVFFDMGYTLVYFEPPQQILAAEALRLVGVERSADQIVAAARKVWGETYRGAETATFSATPEHDAATQLRLERRLLDELGVILDEGSFLAYREAVEAGFDRPGVIRPYDEVPEVLRALEIQGYRLGIVSNWSWNLRKRVQQAGLDGAFEVIWASAYAGCNKPHPGIFYQALVQMDVPAERAFYVGDSYEHDVVGARNAGVDVALLDREGSAGCPDCDVIQNLWGVFQLLRRNRDSED